MYNFHPSIWKKKRNHRTTFTPKLTVQQPVTNSLSHRPANYRGFIHSYCSGLFPERANSERSLEYLAWFRVQWTDASGPVPAEKRVVMMGCMR